MKIRVLPPDQVETVIDVVDDAELSLEALVDFVRSQSLALGPVPRRVLLDTVGQFLEPKIETDRELLLQAVGRLVETGDLVAGDRGRIGPAPLRAVKLTANSFLLAGALPTDEAVSALQAAIETEGAVRRATVESEDAAAFESKVLNLGGVVLDLNRWAGLDRVPPAGEAWLRHLGRPAAGAGSAVTPDFSEMQVYLPTVDQPIQRRRWKRNTALPSNGLVRWRREGGWHEYAWVAGGESAKLVGLSNDDARRTMFSVDREHGCSVSAQASRNGGQIVLEIDAVVPFAEYRALLGLLQRTNWREWPVRYQGDRQRATTACAMLEERLGIVCADLEGDADAEA